MITSTTAAVFNKPNAPFELREIPIAPLQPGEILVEVTLCTICGSDLHTFTGRRSGECPTILGHEILGRVVEVAGNVTEMSGRTLQPGDRITWSIAASCGDCFPCKHDIPQKCDSLVKYGHAALNEWGSAGGLAQHCRLLPGTAVCRIPDGLDDASACPVNCCTATAAASLRTAGAIDGATVLVLGAGSLGLTAAAMATLQGAKTVFLADINASRLEQGAAIAGCTTLNAGDSQNMERVIRDHTAGRGADIAIEMTGSTDATLQGLGLLRTGGRLILVGAVYPTPPLELSAENLVRRLLRIEGVHNYRPEDLATAVDFLASADANSPARNLVEREFPLDEVDAAFQYALEHKPLRVAIRP